MIIIRFQGGLGNQMFQYAFLCAMQQQYPQHEIKVDLTAYRSNSFHYGFELARIFDISIKNIANRQEIMKFSSYVPMWRYGKVFFRIKEKIASKIRNTTSKKSMHLEQKNSLIFYDEFFHLDKALNYYIEGFWCNEDYFFLVKEKVLQKFKFDESLHKEKAFLLKDIRNSESVSIHVRRGDYTNSVFDIITLDYYKKAINIILNKIDKPIFYIFSDDLEYVEQEFFFLKDKKIVTDNVGVNSYKDMFLMSQCKHNIIANSTFSYWGAYLNKNKNKIVIAPRSFNKMQLESLACNSWIKLDN